jgi:hypothetical protein
LEQKNTFDPWKKKYFLVDFWGISTHGGPLIALFFTPRAVIVLRRDL